MHERNLYKTPPDFESLAHAYPALRPQSVLLFHSQVSHLPYAGCSLRSIIRAPEDGSPTIDFHDENAQRRLTQALMFRDFDIQLEIPDDKLCPPVPNRLNYVLWLQDILSHSSSQELQLTSIRGIDVGTGASAIYPLLACRLSPNWHFVATGNVDRNGLSERISVLPADPTGPILFPLTQDPAASFDFSMCNPPFYASAEEVASSAAAKALSPNAVCTGSEVEMITDGGEQGFVSRMVRESLAIGERCRWYTSMLGKLSSLIALVTLLRAHSITNYALTELVQGHTRRWALAWSFTDARLADDVARPSAPALHRLLPPRTTFRQRLDRAPPAGHVVARRSPKEGPAVEFSGSRPGAAGTGTGEREEGKVALVAHVWVEEARVGKSGGESGAQLVVQWMRGRDAQVFESFASHVARKIREALVSGSASHIV
ncbi:hypothetical protein EI94DRAFT_1773028 [Lactarius quietus]|nr:hypothetical protein EI94DRAFT_1773028 [Lactarius quietus]